jgi:hypothetical protein
MASTLRRNVKLASTRRIAASLSIGPTAVGDCMRRARGAGLSWHPQTAHSWPLPEDLSDEAVVLNSRT